MNIKSDAFKGLTHLNGLKITLALKDGTPIMGRSGETKLYNLRRPIGAGVFLTESQAQH